MQKFIATVLTFAALAAVLILFLSRNTSLFSPASPSTDIPKTGSVPQTVAAVPDEPAPEGGAPETQVESSDSYIGVAVDNEGWRYTLSGIEISDELPDGISLSDIYSRLNSEVRLEDKNGNFIGWGDKLKDHFDERGRYDGYNGDSFRWVFVSVDIQNLGEAGTYHLGSHTIKPDIEGTFTEWGMVYQNLHNYSPDMSEEYKKKHYSEVYFQAEETKSVVLGYLIGKEYADVGLLLALDFRGLGYTVNDFGESIDTRIYLPLK